jgi:hypothetical protein
MGGDPSAAVVVLVSFLVIQLETDSCCERNGARRYHPGVGNKTVRKLTRSLLVLNARGFAYASRALRYAAAGLLDRRELMESALEGWRAPADPVFASMGWFAWERELYEPYAAPGRRVLAIGAGQWRDVLPFVELGCDVVAVEPVSEYAECVPRGIALHRMYAEDLPLERGSEGRFDVFLHSTYAYTLSSDVRIATLVRTRSLLVEGGCVLLSVPDDPRPIRGMIRFARFTARLSRADWMPEAGDLLPDGTFRWIEHRFAKGEIEREAHLSELRVVRSRVQHGMRLYELAPPAR